MASNQASSIEQKKAAQAFVKHWQEAPCIEEEHSRSFWLELLGIIGISNPTRVLDFERKVKGRKIDIFYEDMGILIEMKSRGVSLDEASQRSKKAGYETPYQQAKWYADNLPYSIRPRWLITCNFDEFRIYDLEHPDAKYTELLLKDLPDQLYLFDFFTDQSQSRLVKEQELSIEAGNIVGKLYKSFARQYQNIETDEHEQRSLNVLIVRLVFLLYAEDAGLLQSHLGFCKYMENIPTQRMRQALIDLFRVLNTPEDKRDPYLDEDLAAFPYINGGLFEDENIIIPQFTDQLRNDLLLHASRKFDWKDISPTIFGAVFESTLNPETRRSGGMHYTSIENIHKVIDPLFLDDLKAELGTIEGIKVEKERNQKLRIYQHKLASLTFLDPAAGSHNFLTETYICLRKLELRIIEDLQGDQTTFSFDDPDFDDPILVNINQFYAIEINEFAVSVGKTALWIAEQQMMEKTHELLPYQEFNFLPLKSVVNSHCANALRIDWNDVLPAYKCNYIMGNPPFVGFTYMSPSQKNDMELIFPGVKNLDYVCCWYKKASEYSRGTSIETAYVSTNSIVQGETVSRFWKFMPDDIINFAYKTFVWDNEATVKAHVHCIIIGYSKISRTKKYLFDGSTSKQVKNINYYLIDGDNILIDSRNKPICNIPKMIYGNKPADGGYLIIEDSDYQNFIDEDPYSINFIRPLLGATEYINGKKRWCLWLDNVPYEEIRKSPLTMERIQKCKESREQSIAAGIRKFAKTPALFAQRTQPMGVYFVIVPRVSSQRRSYVPMSYLGPDIIVTDAVQIVPEASLYVFGIMTSSFHMSWMRVVCGRLKSDYRYSKDIVYNNFPWPYITPENITIPVEEAAPAWIRENIEQYAQTILDTRDEYPDSSLADLYDPDKMPYDLLAAHEALDAAVEEAYGVNFNGDEEKIVAHLFKLYADLTKGI